MTFLEIYGSYLNYFRMVKNNLLKESDWTELPSSLPRLGEAKVAEWVAYRNILRDMSSQEGFDPESPNWPVKPE